jgi:hypothetical protein
MRGLLAWAFDRGVLVLWLPLLWLEIGIVEVRRIVVRAVLRKLGVYGEEVFYNSLAEDGCLAE